MDVGVIIIFNLCSEVDTVLKRRSLHTTPPWMLSKLKISYLTSQMTSTDMRQANVIGHNNLDLTCLKHTHSRDNASDYICILF